MRWIRQSLVLQFLIICLFLTTVIGVSVGTTFPLGIEHATGLLEHATGLLIEDGKALESGIEIDPNAEISTPRLISEVGHLRTATYSLLAGFFSVFFIGVVAFFWVGSGRIRKQRDEQRRLAEENALIAEVGRIINSSLDINDVYARVTEEARKVIRFDRMSVSFVDFDENVTIHTYTSGVDIPGRQRGDHTPLVGALAGEVALRRLSIMFEAESEEEVLHRFPLLLPAFRSGLRSFISVPLINRDSVMGVFQIRSAELGAYRPRDLAITERIAAQIAGALANARLYEDSLLVQEELRRLARETSVLADIGRVISSSLDINEVYDRLGQEVQKLMPFDRMSLSLIDHERQASSPT